MPWSKHDYPASMKNLDTRVRNKAIEIANARLEEGDKAGRAIAIAIAQARKWAGGGGTPKQEADLHVVSHPRGWAVRRAKAERASYIFDSKQEAQDRALEMAANDGVLVIVHQANGQIEGQRNFAD